jgi:hypothetical protein
MIKIFENLGGRRLLASLIFFTAVTVPFYLKLVNSLLYVEALEWALALYFGANVLKAIPEVLLQQNGGSAEDPAKNLFDAVGGRKFFCLLGYVAALSFPFYLKWDLFDAPLYIDALKWGLAFYLTANTLKSIPELIAARGKGPNGQGGPVLPTQPEKIQEVQNG